MTHSLTDSISEFPEVKYIIWLFYLIDNISDTSLFLSLDEKTFQEFVSLAL